MTSTTSNSSNESNILDEKIALVSISVGTFAGYRRLTRAMIADLGGKLPASAAVTEGSIKVFPNGPLKSFYTRRRKIFRQVAEKGIKALGSRTVFAVPKATLPEIQKLLDEGEVEHKKDVAKLDGNYETIFDAHLQANPEAAAIITSLKVPKAAAMAKMRFTHKFFSISPVHHDGVDRSKGVESLVADLTRQLYEEVAEVMAELSASDSLTGKIKAGQRTLRPIKAQIAKMKGLSFLDSSVDHAVQFISAVLATLPAEGYIEDTLSFNHFTNLQRLVEKLSDADDILDAAGKTANGIAPQAILFPVKQANPVQAALSLQAAPAAAKPAAKPAIPRPTVPLVKGGIKSGTAAPKMPGAVLGKRRAGAGMPRLV